MTFPPLIPSVQLVRTGGALAPGLSTPTLPPSVDTLPENAPPIQIAAWRDTKARPCEVALYAEFVGQPYGSPPAFPLVSPQVFGGQSNADQRNAGFFKITYGCGGIARIRYVDLMNARLFLGTCDVVEVVAYRWVGPTEWGGTVQAINVGASIGECGGGAFDEFQLTTQLLTPAGFPVSLTLFGPLGTYGYETGLSRNVSPTHGAPSALPIWGSTEPDVLFTGDIEAQVYRPSQYAVVPSTRRFKGCRVEVTSADPVVEDLVTTVRWYMNS